MDFVTIRGTIYVLVGAMRAKRTGKRRRDMNCPIHKIEMVPIKTSDHYRCLKCFDENEGVCEYSGFELLIGDVT